MKKTPLAWLLVAAALVTTACAAPPAATPAGPGTTPAGTSVAHLTGYWLLTDLGGSAPVAGSSVTANFSTDGVISGSAGCNRYSGTFTTTGSAIKIGEQLASTMMMCTDPAVMTQETAFLKALGSARAFVMNGTELKLNDESGKTLTTFAAESQKLADTSWKVTNYNNGKQAVVNVLADTAPTVTFGADGSVSGSSGCNSFNGSAVEGAGTVKIGPLASTRKLCPTPEGVMEQEAALLAALESGATFTIEGNKLEIRTADKTIAVQLTKA